MADPNQSKKETVQIALPGEAAASEALPENPRINLPARPPANAPAAPSAPSSAQQTETAGPRKETARVGPSAEQPSQRASSMEMKKTQPLFTMPEAAEASVPPVAVTSNIEARIETVPPALCWIVLAISALLLIMQIWNYFS